MIKEISGMKVMLDDENNRLIFEYDGDEGLRDFAKCKKDVSVICNFFGEHLLDILFDEYGFEFKEV